MDLLEHTVKCQQLHHCNDFISFFFRRFNRGCAETITAADLYRTATDVETYKSYRRQLRWR